MEQNRSSKIVSVVALVVAIVGLAVGFAAFSNVLTIKPAATVTPSENTFLVKFSSSTGEFSESPVAGVGTGDASAGSATIVNGSSRTPVISNLTATFTEPGQSVTYSFYTYNAGEYDAYLREINFDDVATESSPIVCTAGDGATEALVTAACGDITISVQVGTGAAYTESNTTITGHSLVKGGYEPVVVTITYAENGDRADGNFSVAFGDISLTYSSVDGN